MATEKFFEDYAEGDTFTTGGRTVTESDIGDFVELCGLFEPIFTDVEHVRSETPYDDFFAPGEMTASFALGNVIRSSFVENAITMLDLDISFERPVFGGDTIAVDIEVAATHETSSEDRGVVVFDYDVTNQDGETVLTMSETALIRARGD